MRYPRTVVSSALAVCIAFLSFTSFAQDTSNLPYMNPKLPPEERAADLVHRMTLEEKASQLVNQSRAIPDLNVPAYDR
jgi:beta-glucosidase